MVKYNCIYYFVIISEREGIYVKKKSFLTMRTALLLLGLIPMVVAAIIIMIRSIAIVDDMVMKDIESQLHSSVELAAQHFNMIAESGDGTWVVDEDEILNIGGVVPVMPEDAYLSSALDEDVYLTLFIGDTRYATSIKDANGKPVIGTKASDAVIADVLKGGKTKFIAHVEIVGQDFSGYYMPLKDASGTTIGMMFAGRPYADTEKEIKSNIISLVIIIILCIVIFGAIAMVIAIAINKRIKKIADDIQIAADGDFANEFENTNKIRDLAEISENLESMRVRLRDAIAAVIEQADAVNTGADLTAEKLEESKSMVNDINHAVSDLAQGATAMAGDVQDTAELTGNIGVAIDQVMAATTQNIEITGTVFENASQVQGQLEDLKVADKETDAMAGQVQDSVNETAKVVEEISRAAEAIISIASETNLLALNASIEAARAGEAGKGFAVVADNIKNLAEESDKSATEITGMLQRISSLSEQNKNLTQTIKEATTNESVAFDEMSVSFSTMENGLRESEESSKQIEDLVTSVNNDKNAITDAVERLSSISEENAASTEETSASLTQLTENMDDIAEQANQLKLIANSLADSISFFNI